MTVYHLHLTLRYLFIYIWVLFTNTQNLLHTCVSVGPRVISQCLYWQSTTVATAQYNDKCGKFFVTLSSLGISQQKKKL